MAQRNIVVAEYKCYSFFPVPKGVDLEDKSVVEWWYVKWDSLRIQYVDGRYVEIEKMDCEDDYTKDPEETKIEPAEDYSFSDDDFSDDEEEETKK